VRAIVALVATCLGLGALTAAPASAGARPDQVGRISIVGATDTTLRLTWPSTPRAGRYRVERGTDLQMTGRSTVRTTDASVVTVTGLRPGRLYCFQVRAENRNGLGPRSKRSCQYTNSDARRLSAPTYRVVTYNICSTACSGWSWRRSQAAALLKATSPDVVALQEATRDNGLAHAMGGFTQVVAKSGKALLYRSARFSVVRGSNGQQRVGSIDLGYDPRGGKNRYAVWAELADKRNGGRRVVFVSTHLSSGTDAPVYDAQRRRDATRLVAALRKVNAARRAMVVAGDFNSHAGRTHNSPETVMERAGFASAFYNANQYSRPNYNSGNRGRAEPAIGNPWGYHMDQVWADPDRTDFVHWRNAARIVNGKYPQPSASNHNPILVVLRTR
jgi:endonuclease/exonuclease/phosphatase family metal-dependent hydrolase